MKNKILKRCWACRFYWMGFCGRQAQLKLEELGIASLRVWCPRNRAKYFTYVSHTIPQVKKHHMSTCKFFQLDETYVRSRNTPLTRQLGLFPTKPIRKSYKARERRWENET